jgi:hypothetical protein
VVPSAAQIYEHVRILFVVAGSLNKTASRDGLAFADISLSDWLTHSPPEMVPQTLNIDEATIAKVSQ